MTDTNRVYPYPSTLKAIKHNVNRPVLSPSLTYKPTSPSLICIVGNLVDAFLFQYANAIMFHIITEL